MRRVSNNLMNSDMQFHLRRREWKMNEINNKMASQTRIQNLRDDPLAASRATRFQSDAARLARYSKNIETVRGNNSIAEGYLMEANDIMQRVRELSIQGANGIYTKEELSYMGEEVDQLLHELVVIGNARSPEGTTMFGGFKNSTEPFKATMGNIENATGSRMVKIDYVGNIGQNLTEISEGAMAEVNFPGNKLFWAENQQVYSTVDATGYQVQQDSVIEIDGQDINLKAGDNVYAIINKINDSDTAVKASLDPVRNSLVLETTVPHQLWLKEPGSVLQDLGIIQRGEGSGAPLNVSDSAIASGGSLFDMVINLRDNFYKGDTLEIGGAGIRGIDDAMKNLRTSITELGAKDRRLELTSSRIDYETPEVIRMSSNETDLDLTQAITELKMIEFTHQAALSTTAKILKPTLLDFLR